MGKLEVLTSVCSIRRLSGGLIVVYLASVGCLAFDPLDLTNFIKIRR